MEPLKDRNEENEWNTLRVERLERMRREKQKQAMRRRMIRKWLPLGVGGLGVIAFVLGMVVMVSGGNAKTNDMGQQMAAATQVPGMAGGAAAEEAVSELMTEATPQPSATESPTPTEVPNTALLAFEETTDTVTIYSEEVISTNALLIDLSNDTIVASKGAYEKIYPASMTKVLTILVAAEQLSEEDLDDTLTMTLEITDYSYVNDCSNVGFFKDEEIPVRDLFYGTILPSGGDAALGLAMYVSGSHEEFVKLMNEKLEELGLADSAHFTNCVGLFDEEHYCTVYDMAVIMKAALENDFCREVLSARTYTTTPTVQHPEGILLSNWFIRRIEDKDTRGTVLGAKTGYVDESQSCAVSYGIFAEDKPYLCVTTGSSSSWRCIYDHVEIYTRYISS